jgi:hypothetical protein
MRLIGLILTFSHPVNTASRIVILNFKLNDRVLIAEYAGEISPHRCHEIFA